MARRGEDEDRREGARGPIGGRREDDPRALNDWDWMLLQDMRSMERVARSISEEKAYAQQIGEAIEAFEKEDEEHRGLLWTRCVTLVGFAFASYVHDNLNDV